MARINDGQITVTRMKSSNWDGSYYLYGPIKSEISGKNWKQLLSTAMGQSFQPKTNNSKKQLGFDLPHDFVYTMANYTDSEDYDTEWTHIDFALSCNGDKIMSFRRMNTKRQKGELIRKHSIALKLVEELNKFCQVKKPEQESEGKSASASEMKKNKSRNDVDTDYVDPDDTGDDYHAFIALMLHNLVDKEKLDVPEDRNVGSVYI